MLPNSEIASAIFQQTEVGIGVLIKVQFLEAHEEFHVAMCGIKVWPISGGAEELDAMYPAAADALQLLTLLLN